MLTLRPSPFELFERLEQQLSQQLQGSERVPSAEVHETPEAYEVVLELPGVDKEAINVRATDCTLVISAERRSQRERPQPALQESDADAEGDSQAGPLLSEFHYGTWSRSFRFPAVIDRDQLQARYRDGLLTVTAPKAQKVTTVRVNVEA
jgi:HSP20 family protein